MDPILTFSETVRAEIARRADTRRNWMMAALTVSLPGSNTPADASVKRGIQLQAQKLAAEITGANSLLTNNAAGYDTLITAILSNCVGTLSQDPKNWPVGITLSSFNTNVHALVAFGIADA